MLDAVKDIDEVTHDITENGDTDEQDECAEDTLRVRSRMVVTKTNSRESSKGIVHHHNHVLNIRIIFEIKMVNEALVLVNRGWCDQGNLAEDEPDHADKVRHS